jgi:hypothetical protein
MDGEKKMSNVYDLPVNFKVVAATEEDAERNLMNFLKMASLDFGLTYRIREYDLVEFIATESGNV